MPLVRAVANKLIFGLLVLTSLACVVLGAGLYAQQKQAAEQRQQLAEQRQRSAEFTRCTAEWQADFLTAYEARAMASIDVSDAMDAIVKAVARQDSAAFNKAVRHYLAVRDRQDKERARHPLPPLPSVRCGE